MYLALFFFEEVFTAFADTNFDKLRSSKSASKVEMGMPNDGGVDSISSGPRSLLSPTMFRELSSLGEGGHAFCETAEPVSDILSCGMLSRGCGGRNSQLSSLSVNGGGVGGHIGIDVICS
jgi:hypothetical protein